MPNYNNPYGNYNPYQNYYQPQMPQSPLMPQQTNQYAYVNGVEGAKSYQVPPGKTVLLIDNDNPYIYFKTANELGQSGIRYFSIKETDENTARGILNQNIQMNNSEYVLKSDFEELTKKYESLNKKINKLLKSDTEE